MPAPWPSSTWQKHRVLLVDDDQDMTQMLQEYLLLDNFEVSVAHDAREAFALLEKQQFDLLLLDLMLPYMNGLDFLRHYRQNNVGPVIMLSAHGSETDRVLGLESGADDYVAKPFGPRELKARMLAVLRRSSDVHKSHQHSFSFGPLTFHGNTGHISWHDQPVSLTATEERVLERLIRTPLQLVSREELSHYALGRPLNEHDRSLDTHISNIRRKLSLDAEQSPIFLRSVRGQGYLLSAAVAKGN